MLEKKKDSNTYPIRILASPAFKSRKVNPYTYELYTRIARYGVIVEEFNTKRLRSEQAPDIWHIHWPEGFLKFSNPIKVAYRLMRFWRRLRLASKQEVRIVWTIHNLGPHEKKNKWFESLFWKIFLPSIDGCIHLSEAGRNQVEKVFPELAYKQSAVIPHPHYRKSYENKTTRQQARQRLSIEQNAFVILCIGQIRPYKNVPQLIRVFSETKAPDAKLIIAGRPRDKILKSEIEALAAKDTRVIARFGFVRDCDLQFYFNATDITIAPYSDVFNSGTALMSLSFDRPIVMPRVGALPELEQEVGEEWVRLYDGNLSAALLAEQMRRRNNLPDGVKADLSVFDPNQVAERSFKFFWSLV